MVVGNVLNQVLSEKYHTHLVAGIPISSNDYVFLDGSLLSSMTHDMVISSPASMLESGHCIVSISFQWTGPVYQHDTSSSEQRNTERIELPYYNDTVMEDYTANWYDDHAQ